MEPTQRINTHPHALNGAAQLAIYCDEDSTIFLSAFIQISFISPFYYHCVEVKSIILCTRVQLMQEFWDLSKLQFFFNVYLCFLCRHKFYKQKLTCMEHKWVLHTKSVVFNFSVKCHFHSSICIHRMFLLNLQSKLTNSTSVLMYQLGSKCYFAKSLRCGIVLSQSLIPALLLTVVHKLRHELKMKECVRRAKGGGRTKTGICFWAAGVNVQCSLTNEGWWVPQTLKHSTLFHIQLYKRCQ